MRCPAPAAARFGTRAALDEFLTSHGFFGSYTEGDLKRDRQDLQRLGSRRVMWLVVADTGPLHYLRLAGDIVY